MKDDESVEDFAAKVSSVVTSMRSLGEKVLEISVIRRFLRAAPAHYMQLVTSIEQCNDLTTFTLKI